MIVVDSNVLAARNLTGTKTALAERVELIDAIWIVPRLWRYEFQNILAKGLWAGQYTEDGALQVWQLVMSKMSANEHEPAAQKIMDLSGRYRITAYDANFIALAMEMGVMCVTEDGELQEKFPAIAVSMEVFTKSGPSGGMVNETHASFRTRKRK